jgi:serine/threonine-protein phosphatase 2A regulatory subunit B
LRAQQDAQYAFLAEFQSHEPACDYLKSLEINEKINSIRSVGAGPADKRPHAPLIARTSGSAEPQGCSPTRPGCRVRRWCRGSMGCKMLLSTNDKTIKLWKIHGKKIKVLSNMNIHQHNGAPLSPETSARRWTAGKGLRLPRMATCERVVTATPKREFPNAHAFHINSIALNSDGESFMSCDDLRLNLWNLNYNSSCSNIVDIKPANMNSLSEVITSADFHPTDCHTFLYSSSRGCVHLGDMRAAALCDRSMKTYEGPEDPATSNSRFSEIVSSISHARFSRDGRHFVTRDCLNVRCALLLPWHCSRAFTRQSPATGTALPTVLPRGL